MILPTIEEIEKLQKLPGFAGREAHRPSLMRDKALLAIRAETIAALSRQLAERQWQPIETAPRDGNFIDIWDGYNRITDAWFSVKLDAFVHDSLPDMNGDVYDQKIHQPTHWMPLPPGPEGEGESI